MTLSPIIPAHPVPVEEGRHIMHDGRKVLYRKMVIDGKYFWDQVPLHKWNVSHCAKCGRWASLLEEWRTTDQELLYMVTNCGQCGVQKITPEIYYKRYPHLRRYNI